MIRTPRRTFVIGLTLWAAACAPGSHLDETATDEPRHVRVITSGGFAAAYNILGPQFEDVTGVQLETAYGASSGSAPDSIPARLSRGEPADVIILSRSSLDDLTERGEVRPESRVDLVRSLIGMAVRRGAHRPDISSKAAFIGTLLAAESIGYSASASGTYLSTVLFPELGIWEQIEGKSTRVLSERVASVVARGDGFRSAFSRSAKFCRSKAWTTSDPSRMKCRRSRPSRSALQSERATLRMPSVSSTIFHPKK